MRDDEMIELELNRITPKERLTVTGATILFIAVAALITAIVHLAPPNIAITKIDYSTHNFTEHVTGD